MIGQTISHYRIVEKTRRRFAVVFCAFSFFELELKGWNVRCCLIAAN